MTPLSSMPQHGGKLLRALGKSTPCGAQIVDTYPHVFRVTSKASPEQPIGNFRTTTSPETSQMSGHE